MERAVTPAITKWKEPKVRDITEDIKTSRTVAIVDLVNLPSRQLQEIRAKVKGKIKIQITRKRLLKRALEASGISGADKLAGNLKGMSALIFSDLESFELFRLLKANMSDSFAKAGMVAPFDIKVKAGPTPFSPGPILSELGDAGLKASIEGGKVVIKEDAVVVKEGDVVPVITAGILSRLDIKPVKVGLNLVVALEEGNIMERGTLDINVEEFEKNVQIAHSEALKLAVSQNILTKETSVLLVQKAAQEALALARAQDILTDETTGEIIAKAEKSALAVKTDVDSHQPTEPKTTEEKTNEPSEETGAQEEKKD